MVEEQRRMLRRERADRVEDAFPLLLGMLREEVILRQVGPLLLGESQRLRIVRFGLLPQRRRIREATSEHRQTSADRNQRSQLIESAIFDHHRVRPPKLLRFTNEEGAPDFESPIRPVDQCLTGEVGPSKSNNAIKRRRSINSFVERCKEEVCGVQTPTHLPQIRPILDPRKSPQHTRGVGHLTRLARHDNLLSCVSSASKRSRSVR